MEKYLKNVKTVVILLIAILISTIAFFGLYVQKAGVWKNILKDYTLGMELKGFRELRFELDNTEESKEVYVDADGNYMGDVIEETTEESTTGVEEETEVSGKYQIETRTIKVNDPSNINIENFEKSKKIIQDRLEDIDLYEYNIRLDSVTGELIVEVPDDENIDLEETLVLTVGKVTITDYQTGVLLIDDSHVKKAAMLGSNENGEYQGYLQIQFDEEGTEILKQLSNEYVAVISGDGTETINYISVNLDSEAMISTYFGEELTTGVIQIPIGSSTTEYSEYLDIASRISTIAEIISKDSLPLTYVLTSNTFIESPITNECKVISTIFFAVIIFAVSVVMVVKYKFEGLRQAILSIGYIGILSLVLRYTNVKLTINALIAILGVIAINYAFGFKFLNKLKNEKNRKTSLIEAMKELYLSIIPVCIIAIIFTFMSGLVISSIGMTLFWGLLIQALLSIVVLV